MKDITKNLLTHGAAAGGGYFFGRRSNGNGHSHHTMFSRFIPTVIFAAGIAYFAIKTPGSVKDVITTSSDNNTKIELQKDINEYKLKDKALDKGINIYDNKTKEFDDLQKQFETYKNNSENEKQTLLDISTKQNQKLNNIESKLNNITYKNNTSTNNPSSKTGAQVISSKESNAYTTWLALDKTDQRFYFYKNGELEKSGPMIFNGDGKPVNGIYDVKKIAQKSGALFPGFATLDGIIGISGAGQNNEYAPAICNSSNVTNNGFRISNADMDYLMSKLHLGTKVEVRY